MMHHGIILLMLGLFLFFAGLLQCISSKRFLGFLFGIEMILNAASINLAGFSAMNLQRGELQTYIIMITALAAIEAAVGLSIFIWISNREGDTPFSIL